MMKILAGFKSGLISISVLIAGNFIGQIPAQAIETAEQTTVMTALVWIKCNESLRTKSSLYQEAEEFLRAMNYDVNLLLDSRIDAFAQSGVDENPLKVCERFMGFGLAPTLMSIGKKAESNFKYMAKWKKKAAVRTADYWCKYRTLDLTDSQLDDLYDDIILIVEQEGVQRYVDDYAIESAALEIGEAAGLIVVKRKQNGTCQIFN